MQSNDTTRQSKIPCRYLSRRNPDMIIYVESASWGEALREMWPEPHYVLLRKPDDGSFIAVRLDSEGKGFVAESGATPESAKENLLAEWERHLADHPEEWPRRRLRPLLHLLKANSAPVDGNWDDLLVRIGRSGKCSEARTHLRAFLDRMAPTLAEEDRRRAFRTLERVPYPGARQQVMMAIEHGEGVVPTSAQEGKQ